MKSFISNKYLFSTIKNSQAGYLYTWGLNLSNLGYQPGAKYISKPRLIENFKDITHFSQGVSHSAFVTSNDQVYAYGIGTEGQLGENKLAQFKPGIVEYFTQNNVDIQRIQCGGKQTLVLGKNGKLYAFGWIGATRNVIYRHLITSNVWKTSKSQQLWSSKPRLIQFSNNQKIRDISVGSQFSNAVSESNKLYTWGTGIFGDGSRSKSADNPIQNKIITDLINKQNITITKIKSCKRHTVALFSNNKLYAWGKNSHGQLGVQIQKSFNILKDVYRVTPVVDFDFNSKIVDFDISENIMIILLQNGEVWWSGLGYLMAPQRFQIDQKGIKVAACTSNLMIATKQDIIILKDFPELSRQKFKQELTQLNKQQGYKQKKLKIKELFDGRSNIIGMGGQNNNYWALVN